MSKIFEVNFDGLVGPSHHYGGLSFGNIASLQHKFLPSNPKLAALQGLEKMRLVMDLKVPQAIIPPQERPHILTLRKLGYQGSDEEIFLRVSKENLPLLLAVSSASSMWAANAANTTPAVDALDEKIHLTPSNLVSNFHRSIETNWTERFFRTIFEGIKEVIVHSPLPASPAFGDEGSANHIRLAKSHESKGVHLFVHGRSAFQKDLPQPKKFPARQTLEAHQVIQRWHQIDPSQVVFARQNPKLIDQGVFHNDLISTGTLNLLLYYEKAFLKTEEVIDELKRKMEKVADISPFFIKIKEKDIPASSLIKSYLFNSQLLKLEKDFALITPRECQEITPVKDFIENLPTFTPIRHIFSLNLRESMQNGGGVACLRLKVLLSEKILKKFKPRILLTNELYLELKKWIEQHFRDHLTLDDLRDPILLVETREALDKLTQILNLGSIYDFQRERAPL